MPIPVVCRSCGARSHAPDSLAGRKAKCPRCQNIVTIQAAVPKTVTLPAPKVRSLPKRREPAPEEGITHLEEVQDEIQSEKQITHLEEVPDEVESAEKVAVAKAAKKPKRKRRRRPRDRSEQTTPAWLLWLISVGLFALVAFILALPAIYKGYGDLVLLYAVIVAVMLPISTVILIISMFISSWLGGGIEFGEARIVIPKAVGLLLVVNSICLLPFGRFLAAPIWWFGLMFLFGLDWWETRILTGVNWGLNFVAQMGVIALLTAAFLHGGVHHLDLSSPRGHLAAGSAEEQAVDAIHELGGDCSSENDEEDGPIVTVSLAEKPATDAVLTRLKSFPKLRTLDLSSTAITDAGLAHLEGLTSLRSLNLSRTSITDAGLARLKKLNQLETLTLTGTKVTQAGVADLQAALPRVRIVF